MEGLTKRAEKIFESAEEKVAARIEAVAKSAETKYQVAYREGAPSGVMQFYLLNNDFGIVSKNEHKAFLERLIINDVVLNQKNAYIVEESGFEAFIEVEPRKELQ